MAWKSPTWNNHFFLVKFCLSQAFGFCFMVFMVFSCLASELPGKQGNAPDRNNPDSPSFVFEPLEDDRLSSKSFQASVYSIFQDSKGYLWIGMHIGLLMYDGYHIRQYSPNLKDQTTLSDINISSIAEDRDGNIWIGSMDGGISVLDRRSDTFTQFRHDPKDPDSLSSDDVWQLYMSPSGEMWIGTWGGGLNRFDFDSGKFIRYIAETDEAIGLGSNVVNAILEDHTGIIWVGTNNGLDKLDRKNKQIVHYQNAPGMHGSLSDNNVTAIYEDKRNTLWIGTGNGGVNKFDRQADRFRHYTHNPEAKKSISSNKITAIIEDNHGFLWIATIDGGLNRFNPETGKSTHFNHDPSDPESLRTDSIRILHKDRSDIIWAGLQDGGVYKIKRGKQKFHFYHLPDTPNSTLPSETVTAIIVDKDNSIWLGTIYGGLIRFDPLSNSHHHFQKQSDTPNGLSDNFITTIKRDESGTLWVGTYSGGLNRFDPEKQQFIYYQHDGDNSSSISSNSVTAVIEDRSGNLWIGTRDKGLNRFDIQTGQFSHFRHEPSDPQSLSSDNITALCLDVSGDIWIGTKREGLNRFSPGSNRFKRYNYSAQNPHSLSSNNILTLHQDRKGYLWIGTNGGGLNKFIPLNGHFVKYRQKDGLTDETIRAILEDNYGILWLNSWQGKILKFNPQTEIFTNFGEDSGLRKEQSLFGASFISENNWMYFGGRKGFYSFRPYYNKNIPNIQLTRFKLFNKLVLPQENHEILQSSITYTKKIRLSYRDNVFSFEFTALDFTQPELNQYAYMMEGIDDNWIFAGTQNSALYANIPAGEYRFRVKGSNSDGIRNEKGTAISVIITPPLWKTWWAYWLYALMFIALFVGYGRFRAYRHEIALQRQKEEEYRAKLEQEVAQRTSELVETNDQLISEISERRRVEESLRLSEEKYRSIIETAREGYIMINDNLSIIDVNDEFCKMTGFRRNELIGKRLDNLAVDEFGSFLKMNSKQLFRQGGFEVKGKLNQKSGRSVQVLLHGSVLRDKYGKRKGNVIFTTDLSVGEMSLALAAEVQQSLLNNTKPAIEGLDIYGHSRPCEEVGGDYFDLIQPYDKSEKSIIAAIGDISGHGVEAALLMTTARSYLRMRVEQEGSLADIVTGLNRHIFTDVSQTSRFMTFFLLALNKSKDSIDWVRAGHDPALIYSSKSDNFQMLKGKGIALGLDQDYVYKTNKNKGFSEDQIIILTTDGITETHNTQDEMFGKERLRKVIQTSSHLDARSIAEKIYDAVSQFSKGTLPEDDRTLVVIKRM